MPNQTTRDSQEKLKSAIIVGVLLPQEDPGQLKEDLEELSALLATLGIKVKGEIIQKRQKLTPNCLLGTGKALEIKELAEANQAGLVVFDRALSAPQVRNLESITLCQVTDRAGVILEIFAKNARTSTAKTQVEIARLEYLLPRMAGAWTHLGRQTGGVNSRGMGEKQIEIDRRRARERISRLQKQLEQLQKEKFLQRKARRNELKVALVGYTNSGKTTLMNALTHSKLQAKDALFATLDTNVRMIDPSTRPRILLSDTVGFIRNLPHGLIESFKSTLDEVKEADLLLHVVDISQTNYQHQMETTEKVLEEIGAGDRPVIYVFNKMDRVDDPFLAKIMRQAYPNSISVSAMKEADIIRLRDHVYHYFEKHFVKTRVAVAHEDRETLSLIHQNCVILNADYEDQDKAVFDIQAPETYAERLKAFVC